MSGALISLGAKGAQNIFIEQNLDSFSPYKVRYSRYVNFSQKPEELIFPQNPVSNSKSHVRINRSADLLSYIWFEGSNVVSNLYESKFELFIGGQQIDTHTYSYLCDIWQIYMADTQSKSKNINNQISQTNSNFFPLHFFFCDHSLFIPLVALQYYPVEIHITWGPKVSEIPDLKMFANFIYVDESVRTHLSNKTLDFLITQVQETTTSLKALTSYSAINLRSFNHPVKSLFFGHPSVYGQTMVENIITFNGAYVELNGSSISDYMSPNYFHTVQGYYHTDYGQIDFSVPRNCPIYTRYYMYSFGNKVNTYDISGTCNFSRIDAAAIRFRDLSLTNELLSVYAVNYNVFRTQNGMGSLVFSN